MWLTNLKTYRKFLGNNKFFTLVTIMGFAISLMFVLLLSIYVKQELSIDQFHKNKDRIFLLAQTKEKANFANPAADLIKDNLPEVESFTRLVGRNVTIETPNGKVNMETLFADSAFFNMFSFPLVEGEPSKVLATKKSAVVTESFAKKMFQDEDPIGKPLNLDDSTSLTITGIMKDFPKNSQIPQNEVVVNYQMIEKNWGGDILTTWNNSSFTMYFMAKEGADLEAKTPQILELFHKSSYWMYTQGFAKEVTFIPLTEVYFSGVHTNFSGIRTNSKTLVSIYLTITILILVVAILNYINLSVSQAGKRGKEAAMKKLLGCDKKGIIVQFVSESVIMTFVSFFIGLFLAFLAEPFFNDVLSTDLGLGQQLQNIPFSLLVIASIFIIGLISGLIPAMIVSKFQPIEVVKGTYMLKVKSVYSKILISFQYIVAIALLTCSAFIIKQTFFMKNYDLGFNKDNILKLDNTIEPERIPALRSLLEGIAGVDKVSFPSGSPLDGGNNNSFSYKGQSLSFQTFSVDTAFFEIFDIKIKPTGITPSNNTVWVNQKGYDALQPDSISHTVNFEEGGNSVQIAGITNDIHFRSLHTETGPLMLNLRQDGWWPWSIIVKIKTGADLFKTADEIKQVYSEFNGGIPFDAKFADDTVQEWYTKEEKTSKILIAFTILTFVILLMGILAMSLYYVRQKEKEIGIRKVNGATEKEIMAMLNMNFIRWIVMAFVIAVPIAYYIMQQWLENYPYRISLSWWVFALTGLLVVVLSVASISVQSWRAASANPIDSIKSE
ncbi:ABC transporter permease [Dysgonomonas sp. 521]|uniref:ABC transporter permease n=1 Tax=Dysgonomonas sp. 521 TaxID=2302932 RepID=UPI0013D21370|nr:FtsX-like permease family protein [Dysgonomonas sp. 521]NDV93893.1 ABC transporter permease [Dysgonomonas sp. 521]